MRAAPQRCQGNRGRRPGRVTAAPRTVAAVTDRLLLADGTAEVLSALRSSLTGAAVTAPLPAAGAEREAARFGAEPALFRVARTIERALAQPSG